MNRPKRVAVLVVGILAVWLGLCQLGPQVPRADERPAPEPGNRAGIETQAKALPPAGAVALRCWAEQPMTVLSVVPPGQAVKKGDLLVELDAAALVDRREQQSFETRKSETEMVFAKEAQHREEQAAAGQIELAQEALQLAQKQLQAYADGEYPNQLALAQGTARLTQEKREQAKDRMVQLQAIHKSHPQDQAAQAAYQEAQMAAAEADLRAVAAEGILENLKKFAYPNRVAELKLAVAQRQFELARAQDALSAAKLRPAARADLAEMKYEIDKARLQKLDGQIHSAKIYAPQDGTVVYPAETGQAALRTGDVVHARQVLVYLVPATPPQPRKSY